MTVAGLEGCMDSSEFREQMAFDDLASEKSEERELEAAAKRRLAALKAKGHVLKP